RTSRQLLYSRLLNNSSILRELSLNSRSSDLSPRIFYEAIKEYIHRARKLSGMNHFIVAAIADSTQNEFIFSLLGAEKGHFSSAYWDSVYITMDEFDEFFTNADQSPKVAKLRELLQYRSDNQAATCQNLGVKLKVKPGMKAFLRTVEFPERIENSTIRGSVSYAFTVRPNGEMVSYTLLSNRTSLGIEDALEAAFDELSFNPVPVKNQITCQVDFKINM